MAHLRVAALVAGCAGFLLWANAAIAALPGAPTRVVALNGNARASVHFAPPASDGGQQIIGYTVTTSPGGATVSGNTLPIVVNGLTNGTTYTFTVRATNASGNGPESAASNPVKPVLPTITPMISARSSFTLALDEVGQVYAWGSDTTGQLGQGRNVNQPSPAQVPGLPPIARISLFEHALALDTSGQLWSWGDPCGGAVGPRENGNTSRPARVVGAGAVTRAVAGYCRSYLLRSDNTVWEMGNFQAGIRQIAGFTGIVDIVTGGQHVLGRRADNTVWAYGNNSNGQLGQGNTTATPSVVQVTGLPPGVAVTQLAAGLGSSLAVLADGRVFFWGRYSFALPPVTTPTQLTGMTGSAVAASQDGDSIVVARADGTVWRWVLTLTAPVQVSGMSGVTQLEYFGNGGNVFAIGSAGLVATGENTSGQLGQGHTNSIGGVVAVPGFGSGVTQVQVGNFNASVMALKSDGTVWAWGANSSGQVGDGLPIGSPTPLAVPIPATIKAVAAAERTAFALDTNGQVWAWGHSGGLNSGGVSRSTPLVLAGYSNVTAFAAAGSISIVYLKGDGTVWLDGSQRAELSNIEQIDTAGGAGYFRRNDGTLFAAGDNTYGQIGDGTTTSRPTAVPVPGMTGTVAKVAADGFRAAAMMDDGRVYTWGSEDTGVDLTGGTRLPTLVPGLTDAVDIAISADGGFARRSNGSLVAWGMTKLQDAPTQNPTTPFTVVFSEPFTSFALAQNTGYLVGSGGVVWGMGLQSSGVTENAPGDGTYVYRGRPVVALAHAGSGSLDGNNWFLDLKASSTDTIPAVHIPTGLATALRFGSDTDVVGLLGSVKYKSADLGKSVNNYVLALVSPGFFDLVKSAPARSDPKVLQAKAAKNGGFVLAQLTPAGWTDVNGQLIAYSQGVANASGGASSILNGINAQQIPGARFCIGYGESADAMLTSRSLREVMLVTGATVSTSGVPCVPSGVYVSGPATSLQSSPVTFAASVVGLSPTGSVQFKDGQSPMGAPLVIAASNPAVGTASITTSSLAVGTHSINASYPGDGQNPPAESESPRLHVVSAPLAQTQVGLDGPSSSTLGSEVAFVATITGNQPAGTVQFRDGGVAHGSPVPLIGGVATLRTSSLPLGTRSITALYSGDGQNDAGVSPARTHVVTSIPPALVALASSANPSAAGAPVTFTVTVTGSSPTGNVSLRESGGTLLGVAALSGGTATFILSSLAPGLHSLYADYGGDGANTQSTSPTYYQQVNAPPALVGATVTKQGTGTGTVASSPAAIDCGATCSANFVGGSSVTLTATPAGGSAFAGWSGDCAGTGSCVLVMNSARNAAARFDLVGTGVAVAPTGLAFGGQSINTTSPAQTVQVTNNSGETAAIGPITPSNGFAAAHNCSSVANGASCTVTATFTPAVEGAAAANLVLSYLQGGQARVTVIPASGTGERSLVTHYYRAVLRRAPDAPGKAFWEGEAARMQSIGANKNEAWFAMAQFFFFSAEYLSFNRDDAGFVTDLYTTFFNRAPDGGGLAFWTANLQQGMPREVLLASFMFSAEFGSFTQAIFGNTAARAEVDVVMDFYRGLLARLPDPGGFTAWVNNFRTAQCAGAPGAAVNAMVEGISSGFAGSGEYVGRNRTNAQYVGDLYNAFLRRGGDLGGVQFWINDLNASTRTRENVRQNFIASGEFQGRVTAIVNQGCMP